MKIRVAVITEDESYVRKISAAFNRRYPDKIELYSFTDPQIAMERLAKKKTDIVLADESLDFSPTNFPRSASFAYLTDQQGFEAVNNLPAIGKYQKVDLIYSQLLNLYAETSGSKRSGFSGSDTTVIAFCSAAGGTGASTMAAANAVHHAREGKNVLLLNIEDFGSTELYFEGPGSFDFGDIIYALKSKKSNLAMKLESCVREDQNGVKFIPSPGFAMDMLELKFEEKKQLLHEIANFGGYDLVILDLDFSIDKETLDLLDELDKVIMVSDGTESGNLKTFRMLTALETLQDNLDMNLLSKMYLAYNGFSHTSGRTIENLNIPELGGLPRIQGATPRILIETLCNDTLFDLMGEG